MYHTGLDKLTVTSGTLSKYGDGCWIAAKSCNINLYPIQCLALIEETAVLLTEWDFGRIRKSEYVRSIIGGNDNYILKSSKAAAIIFGETCITEL